MLAGIATQTCPCRADRTVREERQTRKGSEIINQVKTACKEHALFCFAVSNLWYKEGPSNDTFKEFNYLNDLPIKVHYGDNEDSSIEKNRQTNNEI